MIRCIAIDDEPKGLEVLQNHIQKLDILELQGVYLDPFKAIDFLNNNEVDLMFLDINMPNINGIDLVKSLNKVPLIIFTTAHSEYAMESYEVKAIDYLLKPFDFSRFFMAVNKARENLDESNITHPNFIFVTSGTQKKRVIIDEILYIEGEGNYVKYVTADEKIMVRSTIKNTLGALPKNLFVQIHRSYVVPFGRIEKVEDSHVYIADERIPVSSKFREEFMELLGKYDLG